MKNSFNLGFVVLLFVVLGCNCPQIQELANKQSSTPSSTPVTTNSPSTTTSSPATTAKTGLTLEKYNQIKNGMTYREVVDIIGSEGTQTMSSGEGRYKVESYKWEGENYQFISIVMMGDKVNSKVQNGLK